MKPVTVVVQYSPEPSFRKTLLTFIESGLVEDIVIIYQEPVQLEIPGCRFLTTGPLASKQTLTSLLTDIKTIYFLIMPGFEQVVVTRPALEKLIANAEPSKTGIVYSDYFDESDKGKIHHPLNDYQPGSVRDDFDFGTLTLYSISAVRKALRDYGTTPAVQYAGLYDIRLKVSIDHSICHIPEPLYSVVRTETSQGDRIFTYVDPKNATVQKEMETVFTDYLKNIGAYLPPQRKREVKKTQDTFPVEASIIIPVRNRVKTITEAVQSAQLQETDFQFNIIVVDNHSTDGTTKALSDLASRHSALHHIIPVGTNLGIGGCWNEALFSPACGRYAVQLDSDDLYNTPQTLRKIVHMLRDYDYAMVIGSYTIVDFNLNEIPPGLIDHREWTDENGHNNALRINGLGAPRAFDTGMMRGIGFLNVSYGEDYAAALQVCRKYPIGRIFESIYLCRRWPGNTDASLNIEATNRNNAFKDKIRTDEILIRQQINRGHSISSA